MKESELRKHCTCDLCGKKVGESGVPLFWTVEIQRHFIDVGAVQRQTALAMMMGGNAYLAAAMGPDEDMTQPAMEPVKLTVCEPCALAERICLEAMEKSDDDQSTTNPPPRPSEV